MKKEELLKRIADKESSIEKIEKRIAKWNNKMNEQAYLKDNADRYVDDVKSIKTLDDLIKAKPNYNIQRFYESYLEDCKREIRGATSDLENAKSTVTKYKNMLMLVEEKESKPVIEIFKNFFNNWKKEIKDFAEPRYKEYLRLESEACELRNSGNYEESKKVNEEAKTYLENAWVKKMRDCRLYSTKTFDEFLDKYMEDRYDELVDKISKITGEITDVSRLYIGLDGSVNGTISGVNGKARLETIIAGGYNIQCRHYRVLVHSIRD